MLIKRKIQEKIEKDLWKGKIIIVYGARQVGKTTLVNQILKKYSEKAEYYNCEESDVAEGLSAGTSTALKNFFGEKTGYFRQSPKNQRQLYPFSFFELKQIYSKIESNRLLERFLRLWDSQCFDSQF